VSFIMAGNRYNPLNIDESKIVKKDQSAKNNVSTSQPKPIQQEITSIPPVVQQTSSQVIPNVIQPEIEQEPIQVTETVIDPIDISEEVVIPKQENISEPEKVRKNNKITSKGQNYLDVVNEYIDNEQNVIKDKLPSTQTSMENMLQETYQTPKIPVYTYSKDLKTGKAKIEPKNKKHKAGNYEISCAQSVLLLNLLSHVEIQGIGDKFKTIFSIIKKAGAISIAYAPYHQKSEELGAKIQDLFNGISEINEPEVMDESITVDTKITVDSMNGNDSVIVDNIVINE